MTATDYLLNIALIALVIRQIRGRRLTPIQLLLPLAIVVWAATTYLHGVPTAGNDLALVAGGAGLGLLLGGLCGLFTKVHIGPDAVPVVRAGWAAALLWVLGVGARMAFALYVQHGGQATIARFSATHQITSGEAWVAALVLMALLEVLARTAVLAVRGYGPRLGLLGGLARRSGRDEIIADCDR